MLSVSVKDGGCRQGAHCMRLLNDKAWHGMLSSYRESELTDVYLETWPAPGRRPPATPPLRANVEGTASAAGWRGDPALRASSGGHQRHEVSASHACMHSVGESWGCGHISSAAHGALLIVSKGFSWLCCAAPASSSLSQHAGSMH